MRLVIPKSEVVTDEVGWTWLRAAERSTRLRHTTGTFFLSLFIICAGATWILLPAPAGQIATVAIVALGLWLLAGIVRGAASKVALSELGLYMQDGGSAAQVGWAAVRGVQAAPAGRRLRIRIDDGHRPRTTRAAFDAGAAREWLALAEVEAGRRQLAPITLPEGAGFTTPS